MKRGAVFVSAGCLLVFVGLGVVGLALLGVLDPVSFKMADDGDPFGPPPTRWWFAAGMLVAFLGLASGIWLAVRGARSLLLSSSASAEAEETTLVDNQPWIVPATRDGARLLRALPTLFPEGGFVYFEDTTEAEFGAWLGAHSRDAPLRIALGTVWPKPDRYHILLETRLMGEGAALIDRYGIALPSIHLHVHDGAEVLLQWYDAFCDEPMFVSSVVPRERVEAFAREMNVGPVSVSPRPI